MNLSLFDDNMFKPESLLQRVDPVLNSRMRGLCVRPYGNNKKGCPNFGDPAHAHRCPPGAPLFADKFDMSQPVYAVINEFEYGAHVEKMLATPKKNGKARTLDEAKCVLYWQGAARAALRKKIGAALSTMPGYEATWCPEGHGVNVTETLKNVGIILEWPPKRIACQVAFLGVPRKI
jgi:hypothetical protein